MCAFSLNLFSLDFSFTPSRLYTFLYLFSLLITWVIPKDIKYSSKASFSFFTLFRRFQASPSQRMCAPWRCVVSHMFMEWGQQEVSQGNQDSPGAAVQRHVFLAVSLAFSCTRVAGAQAGITKEVQRFLHLQATHEGGEQAAPAGGLTYDVTEGPLCCHPLLMTCPLVCKKAAFGTITSSLHYCRRKPVSPSLKCLV